MTEKMNTTQTPATASFCGAEASESCRKVLHAAAAVFAEMGFAGARVDAIAERAGINKAMVYYHVGDKARLYEAVLSESLDRAREALDTALATITSPEERLRAFVSTVSRVARENPHFPALILREFAGGGSNLPESVLRRIGSIFRIVRQVLEEGQTDGSFRVASPLLTHLAIAGSVMFLSASAPIMRRLAELEGVPPSADVSGDVAGPLADLLLGGLLDVHSGSTAGKQSRTATRGRAAGRGRMAPTSRQP
jgi:TetR/AcrR family transcriptional regulator